MPLSDQWQGFTQLPGFGDPANVPSDIKAMFDFLGSRALPRYPTVAARDTELASPINGQLAWVDSTETLYIRGRGPAGTPAWNVLWAPTPAWTDLTSMLISPATTVGSKIRVRAVQGTVSISGEVLGSFVDGNIPPDILPPGSIPEALRPADGQGDGRTLITGTTYLTTSYLGGVIVRPDGSVALYQRTGVTGARGSARFTVSYPQR